MSSPGMTVAAVLLAAVAHAATPAQNCQSGKNKVAGKYAYCRQKAEAKFATTSDAARRTSDLQKCLDKYNDKWPGLEQRAVAAGGACPSVGDQSSIQGAVDDHTDNIATALAGGALSDCPGDLATCNADLTSCTTDLATCEAAPQGQRLKTGQTTCWNSAGTVIACAGTGQDGELQKGLALAFVDNGDGTITDTRTGLMWEKLSADGSIHDRTDAYAWADVFAIKLAALNSGTFAGHSDWRVPNVNELQSIVSYATTFPAVSPAFNTNCTPSCSVLSCSCSGVSYFWTSSTYDDDPTFAWAVGFGGGHVDPGSKTGSSNGLRAVRGGS